MATIRVWNPSDRSVLYDGETDLAFMSPNECRAGAVLYSEFDAGQAGFSMKLSIEEVVRLNQATAKAIADWMTHFPLSGEFDFEIAERTVRRMLGSSS